MRYVLTFGLALLSYLLTACAPVWDIVQQMPVTMGPRDSQGRAPFATTIGDLIENAPSRKQKNALQLVFQRGLAAYERHDDAEALRLFRQAAAEGNSTALAYLGIMYVEGRGVPHDDAQAVGLFQQAVSQGDGLGQFGLGTMYAEGRGVAKNLAEAQRYFAKAAETLPPGDARVAAMRARDMVARELATTQNPITQPVLVTPPTPNTIPSLSNAEEIPLVKVGGSISFRSKSTGC